MASAQKTFSLKLLLYNLASKASWRSWRSGMRCMRLFIQVTITLRGKYSVIVGIAAVGHCPARRSSSFCHYRRTALSTNHHAVVPTPALLPGFSRFAAAYAAASHRSRASGAPSPPLQPPAFNIIYQHIRFTAACLVSCTLRHSSRGATRTCKFRMCREG